MVQTDVAKVLLFYIPFLSLLSSFFLFSSLSPSSSLSLLPIPIPSLFDQFAFHSGLSFPSNRQCCLGASFGDKIRPQIELALPVVNQKHLHDRPIIVDHIGQEASGENPQRQRQQRRRRCMISHARSHPRSSHTQPRSILPISSRGRRRSHPLSSPLCSPFTLLLSGCGFFFFFFAAIWVDLMVVVGCGW